MEGKFKFYAIALFMVVPYSMTYAQELVIEIQNIQEHKGQMIISLFSNADNFLKKPAYEKFVDVETGSHMKIVLSDVPHGNYALCVIHDRNKNGNLDTNFLKIPREPYGFSHNPKNKFGPPPFNTAKFDFASDTRLTVFLN